MKYIFFLLCLLGLEATPLKAQNRGLELQQGDTVIWRISRWIIDGSHHGFESPLFIVGHIRMFKNGRVDVAPHYYLYACSMSSEQWVKSPQVTLEKYSFERSKTGTTVWSVEQLVHRWGYTSKVRPWTAEAEQALTGGQYVPVNQCAKVVAVNLTKTYRR
jgi:hypothetical protein